MPIWYNVATKKKSWRAGLSALLYGLCIAHSPNFLFRFAIIFLLNPLGLTILLANLAGLFYAEDERLNKYPRPCG